MTERQELGFYACFYCANAHQAEPDKACECRCHATQTPEETAVNEEHRQVAKLRTDRDALLAACKDAEAHLEELREAWERGCINETDVQGGTRSNRNISVLINIRTAIARASSE